jgi:hypothetical protein
MVLQSQTINQQVEMVQKMWRTPSVAEEKNQNTSTQIYLQNQVGATPKSWQTPTSYEHADQGSKWSLLASIDKGGRILRQMATMNPQGQGKLNPRWVETLMGIPIGWTMPSCLRPVTIAQMNSDSWATELSPPPQKELFEF